MIENYLIFAQENATLFSFGSKEVQLPFPFDKFLVNSHWPKCSLQTDFMQII